MNGFGFIEYEDAMDARDVVPGMFPSPVDLSSLSMLSMLGNGRPCHLPPVIC